MQNFPYRPRPSLVAGGLLMLWVALSCPGGADAAPAQKPTALIMVPSLIKEAMSAADSIQDPVQKCKALVAIGSARADAGNLGGLSQSYDLAYQCSLHVPDPEAQADAFTSLATTWFTIHHTINPTYFIHGDATLWDYFHRARISAAQVSDLKSRVRVSAMVAAAERACGQASQAQTDFDQTQTAIAAIPDMPARTFAAADMVKEMFRAGDTDGARTALGEAMQIHNSINDGYWKDRTYALGLIEAIALASGGDAAETTARGMKDDYMRSRAFMVISDYYGNMGNVGAARRTAALITGDLVPHGWLSIAKAQAGAGDFNAAKATLKTYLDGGSDIHDDGYASVVKACVKVNDFDSAREASGSIGDSAKRAQAESDIIVAEARTGNVKDACDAAEAIQDPYWKAVNLAKIVMEIMGNHSSK